MEHLGGNFGGENGGINPQEFTVAEPDVVEKARETYTPEDKKINLGIATQSVETIKEKDIKLPSLEKGAGYAM